MLKRLLSLVCLAGLLPFAASALADTPADAAERLMRRCGLWEQLASFAPQVRAGFMAAATQSGPGLSDAEQDRVAQAIDAAYAPERLRAASLASMSRGLDAGKVPALDRWYESALGKRITQMEEVASKNQQDAAASMRRGQEILAALPAPRRAALRDLVVATRSAELMAQVTINTALAVRDGMASVAPAVPGPSSQEMRALLESQVQRMQQSLAEISMAGFAMAYESLSTDDLRRYVRFLQSAAGSHFNAVSGQAFEAAMVDGAAELGRRLPGTKDRSNT